MVFCSVLCNDGLTSAGIVLDEELIQRAPAAAHPHHDGGAQDPHQSQLLRVSELHKIHSQKWSQRNAMLRSFFEFLQILISYPVFALAHLEHLELLPTGALGHLPLDLIVDALGVGEWAALLPVGPQRHHELPPVDHTVPVVELIRHRIHLQLTAGELGP